MHQVEIWASFNCGGWIFVFQKSIVLPFVPQLGINLLFDRFREKEFGLMLINDDSTFTDISYDVDAKKFYVNVRKSWNKFISEESIDTVISNFSNWRRVDSESIENFKELLKRKV